MAIECCDRMKQWMRSLPRKLNAVRFRSVPSEDSNLTPIFQRRGKQN